MTAFKPSKPQDLSMINRALEQASEATRGRIVTVYGDDARGYFWPSLICAILIAAVATLIAALIGVSAIWVIVLQLSLFATGFAGLWFTDLKVRFCPAPMRKAIVARAVKRLITQNKLDAMVPPTDGGDAAPTIMVVVFQREGYAQIVASADAAKAIPAKVWRTLLDALLIDLGHGDIARGLRNTVTACSKLLSAYFPPQKSTDEDGTDNRTHDGHLGGNKLQLV